MARDSYWQLCGPCGGKGYHVKTGNTTQTCSTCKGADGKNVPLK